MNKLLTNLIKASLFSFFFIFCYDAFPSTYYFSSSFGDDSHSNIQAQNQNTPWRSIQKLNSVFSTLQPGDNIMFRNGDTFHGTLIINKSGSSGAPISFGSYGSGENPVLTGFREIKDWVSLGGNVYETYIPEVSSSVSTVMMNDVLQAMGRYPNDNASKSGYLTINSSSWGSLGSSDLQAPASMTGGEIVIRKNNWIIDRHEINWHGGNSVSYNTAGSSYSPAIGYGFFIQNHPATLDKHGEWYFNKATKKLMIYFQGNPSGANIKVSTVDRVINTQNSASHIVLKNLAIQGSNENLINLEKSSSFIIENCQLEYVGKFAINSVMTRNLNVSNSQITNAFNGGINLGWDNRATVVRNNTFRQIFSKPGMGQNSDSQGNGIFMSENSSDVIVEFNEFLECGSNAIYFNGNNINVKNNFIDTFNFVKDDGGGIYTFTGTANTTFSNRKITNNIIVNGIGAVDGTKRFSATDLPYVEGIYLDLFSNGIEIDQNTIGNVKSKGIFLNNARNVSITNNKIFNAGYSIFIARDHTNNLTRNITMKNNEFLNKDSNQLHIYVRSKDNTLGQIGTFENNVYSRPVNENNTIRLETPGKNGLINLQSWKDTYWLDRSSSNSPATYDSDKMEIDEFIRFEYNNSNSSKSVSLSGTYVDLKGKILSGSVELPAYSSVLLLKTEASTTPENAAPAVSITSPSTNSQFIQANNISITSDATDTDGTIAKVDFYNGTTLLGTDTSAPYSYDWNNLPIGNFSITAKATDNKGTATVSEPVVINVIEKANEAPKVTITAPSTNSQFIRANNISITSDATDTDGTITKVDFYNGTSLLGTDTSAPYSFDWNNLPIGNFSITVKATDNKGASTVSAPVVINVIEKANEAPKVNITAPSTNSQFIQANNISITSDATDTDGTIVKVDFYNGTSLLGTDTSAPYSFDWNNLPIGNFSITAKATDNKGTATVSEPVVINVIEKANEAPKVTITAPSTNSQFIQANNISITSDATDNDGTIAKVDFYNGTSLLGTDTTAPYSFDWNNLPIGNFSITAKATDNKGTATVSAPVVINVTEKANEAPKVTITAPSTNSQFIQGEKISITSAATDNDGTIVKVDFYNGTSLLGTDTTAPYSFDWNNLPIGNFSITAKATDNKGTATVSAAVVINVTEKANEAPKVTITAPSTNSQFIQGEKISITSAATDTDGTIAKVDFYNGTSLLGTDTTAPYSFDWTNLPIGNFSITAKATDNKGAATVSEVVNIKIGEKESRSPFGGKAATIPGTVEAENYDLGGQGVGYFDTDAGNIGRMYRTDDVDIEVAVEGGYSVSWINLNEWLEYTVNITTAGAYNLDARVASPEAGGTFHIECNGIDVTGPIIIPATGGWDSWVSVKKAGINLPAGTHTLKYVVDNYGENGYLGNLNSMHFSIPNEAPKVTITFPSTNSQFTQGDNISITSDAIISEETFAKVDFYNGTSLLGTDSIAPYSFDWINLPIGNISITAKGTDNKGNATVSAPVVINVSEKVNFAPETGTGFLQGLVAFYEMNTNLSGVLIDSHGQNHGSSQLINNVNGFIANGNKYDGKSSISVVPHSNSLNLTSEFTLMADVFREGNGQNSGSIIIGKTLSEDWSENQTYSIAITKENKIRIRTNTPYVKDWVSSQTVPLGKWVRIIATYKSGEGYSLYLDNINPEKSPKFSGDIVKSELELKIGSGSYLKDAAHLRRFEGILDNVGMWNRQLTLKEITELVTTKISYPDFGVAKETSSIRIVSPTTNSQFDELSDVHIEIESEITEGEIEKIELHNADTLITTLYGNTSSYTWKSVSEGQYSLKAKAFNVNGSNINSDSIIFKVEKTLVAASNKDLLSGLVAFYEMNTNISGVLQDSHGQNHGTSQLIDQVGGFIENGNKYDGKSSLSSVPHNQSLNLTTEFTLMADIFRVGNGQQMASIIVGKTFSNEWSENQTYSMAITDDNRIRIRTNIPYVTDWVSSKTIPLGKWVRVIASYKSGEGYSIYLDSIDPETSPQYSGSITKSDMELTIGSASLLKNASNLRRFEGILDNVGIWDRKLSQSEIERLITTKITYPEFNGMMYHRIAVSSNLDELQGKVNAKTDLVEAKAGEKLVFMVETEEAQGVVFDHWSIDGLKINNQTLFELEMPEKDITLTKNFRSFTAPEIRIEIPSEKSEFEALSNVHIELEITKNDAQIEKVELFSGNNLVGKLSKDSTGLNWENIPEGNHKLVAKITDVEGKSYFSEQVLLMAVSQKAKDIPNARLDYIIGPNPTTNYLNVIFTNLDGNYDFELRVVSMNGTVHSTYKTKTEESTLTIDVSNLINGVYILQLTANGNEISSKKFIKE